MYTSDIVYCNSIERLAEPNLNLLQLWDFLRQRPEGKKKTMSMDHIFDESQPIYQQIVQRINAKILRGEYPPGGKLPSVIEAAMIYKVNHNTIARAYSELIRSGIAATQRGEGTFVTKDEAKLKELSQEMKRTLMTNFLQSSQALGISVDEIIAFLKEASDEAGALSDREKG